MNLIENTVQPESWEPMSGPGTIQRYYPGSLAFIVRQTRSVHEEIEKLLGRLRDLPPAIADRPRLGLARVPNVGPADIDNWDVRGAGEDLLESIVQPESWEYMAGPGKIDLFASKLVLSIQQTPAIHGEIRSLFAALRRARYLERRHGQTYQSFPIDEGPLFAAALSLTELPARLRQSDSSRTRCRRT